MTAKKGKQDATNFRSMLHFCKIRASFTFDSNKLKPALFQALQKARTSGVGGNPIGRKCNSLSKFLRFKDINHSSSTGLWGVSSESDNIFPLSLLISIRWIRQYEHEFFKTNKNTLLFWKIASFDQTKPGRKTCRDSRYMNVTWLWWEVPITVPGMSRSNVLCIFGE